VTTLNKPDKQDPTAPAKDFRPIGSGEPYHKIAQNPMAREMNGFFAPTRRLAEVGQFGLSKDGITFAGIVPAIVLLEMPKFENAALARGLADVTSAFQLISRTRRAPWEVLCALEDGRIKVKLQRILKGSSWPSTQAPTSDTTFWQTERRWLSALGRE
jgi:hypothetical protein